VASEDEHKLITSNPEEVMKLKQQQIVERKRCSGKRMERKPRIGGYQRH
jgi:hypothetical protein